MLNVALVAFGGAAGSVLRYAVGLLAARWTGGVYPVATLFVNVTGSFAIGLLVELIARRLGGSEPLRLLVLTGVLGGYTTFSTFSLDALVLLERGEPASAFGYVALSVLLGLAAVLAGVGLARQLG